MIFLTKKKKEGGWARLFTVVENCNGTLRGQSLLFSSWVQCHVIWVFSKFHPPQKKQKKNNKIQIQTYTVFTHSSCVNTKTYRCAHIHTHKAPSRTKAYTDIKGPLFSPSYRYSTGGLCCVHLRLCVFVSMCDTMYGVNSCRHPRHTELHGFVCTGILVLCELLRKNSSSTNNAHRSRTIVPLTAFVCGGGETGNEIMLRVLTVCVEGLSKSRARPGAEYQSLINQPCWAYGNEE